jgi:hypothetical protein
MELTDNTNNINLNEYLNTNRGNTDNSIEESVNNESSYLPKHAKTTIRRYTTPPKPKFDNNIIKASTNPHSITNRKQSYHQLHEQLLIPFSPVTAQSNRSEIVSVPQKSPFITFVNVSALAKFTNVNNNINTNEKERNTPRNTSVSLSMCYQKHINDDNFYNLFPKNKKKFLFPQKKHTIKQNTLIHDINTYNKKFVIKDRTVNYVYDAYRFKELTEKDEFVNKIKEDLFSKKYNAQIKAFNNI